MELLLLVAAIGFAIWAVKRSKSQSDVKAGAVAKIVLSQSTNLYEVYFDDEYNDLDHELRSMRNKVKRGDLVYSQFEYRLQQASEEVVRMKSELRSDRKLGIVDDEEYEEALDAISEAESIIAEHRSELKELEDWDSEEARDPRWKPDEKGKWAQFDYTDHDGQPSKRNITMWHSRGRYIAGYDKLRKEERTFRKARIENWQAG